MQQTQEVLLEQFKMPALARLNQLLPHLGEDDRRAVGRILEAADWFVAHFEDSEFRRQINLVQYPRAEDNNEAFVGARRRAEALQADLEALFLSDRPLHNNGDPIEGLDGTQLTMRQLTGRYLLF